MDTTDFDALPPMPVTIRANGFAPAGIKAYKQPYGGWIPVRALEKVKCPPLETLHPRMDENISPTVMGTAVDYGTRLALGQEATEAFNIALEGAMRAGCHDRAAALLGAIKQEGTKAVAAIIQLASYDSARRTDPLLFQGECSAPNQAACDNLTRMINFAASFFADHGPITVFGPTFQGGYTRVVASGDADFLTENTLWDMKCLSKRPTSKHTLQLLAYWRMGLHSVYQELWKDIECLGILNPRMGVALSINVTQISEDAILDMDTNFLGYGR